MTQADFKTLLASGKMRAAHATAIEQMDLVDMGDADHGKRCINQNPGSRFFVCFPNSCLRGGFPILHEAGGKRPKTVSWFDGTPAEQDSILPFGDATNYQAGIFIVDVPARTTDVSR